SLPAVRVLNTPHALRFVYTSDGASPNVVMRTRFDQRISPGLAKSTTLSFAVGGNFLQVAYDPNYTSVSGHQFLWDATDSSGKKVGSGSYNYRANMASVFNGVYQGVTYADVDLTQESNVIGRLLVNNQSSSPFGAG